MVVIPSQTSSLSLLLKLQNLKKLQIVSLNVQKYLYILNIRFSLNNFYITVSDYFGNLLVSQSGGVLKTSSASKKSTFCFELTLLHVLKRAFQLKLNYFILRFDRSLLKKKQLILKLLNQFKFKLIGIHILCLQAFNGVRLPKRRRL